MAWRLLAAAVVLLSFVTPGGTALHNPCDDLDPISCLVQLLCEPANFQRWLSEPERQVYDCVAKTHKVILP